MTTSLSGDARRSIADIADRHGFQHEAGEAMAEALLRSGGGMAQFNHPDLGGMGQWSKGGMTMIGTMNDDRLKGRVGDLAHDLSIAVQSGTIAETQGRSPAPATGASSSTSGEATGAWWPQALGRPASTGSQNRSRYAVFPDRKRLVVDDGGKITVYDTGEETIEGASQQQGGDTAMRFTTRSGSVRVEDLKTVDDRDSRDDARAKRTAGLASPLGSSGTPGQDSGGDAIDAIRRLAELKRDGHLTDAEFAAKKVELLARV